MAAAAPPPCRHCRIRLGEEQWAGATWGHRLAAASARWPGRPAGSVLVVCGVSQRRLRRWFRSLVVVRPRRSARPGRRRGGWDTPGEQAAGHACCRSCAESGRLVDDRPDGPALIARRQGV
jgi:hypothetical protein